MDKSDVKADRSTVGRGSAVSARGIGSAVWLRWRWFAVRSLDRRPTIGLHVDHSRSAACGSRTASTRSRRACSPRCGGSSTASSARSRRSAASTSRVDAGRVRRVPRPQRRRQDDDAQAPVGRHQPHGRRGERHGLRPLGARQRVPPAVRPRDGAEEPALVGPAGRRVVPPPPADLPARPDRATTTAPSASSPSCST